MHFRPTDILISYNASNINNYFYIHISLFTLSCISFLGFPGQGGGGGGEKNAHGL